MAQQWKKPASKSLNLKPVSAADAAKIRGGDAVALKKLPGKRKPPTVTLK